MRRRRAVVFISECAENANDPKLDELAKQYNLHPLHIEDARSADESVKVDTAAHYTYVEEVDCTDLVTLRQRANERLADRGVKLYIHPSHNVPGDTTAHERLDAALAEYKRRIAGV